MENEKRALLIVLMFMPAYVFAHGEEVLFTFFLPVIPAIIFLVILTRLNLKKQCKGLLFIIYAVAIFLCFYTTRNWPYKDTETTTNLIFGFGPPVVTLIAYPFIKSWEKRLDLKDIKSFLDNNSDSETKQ